MTRILFLCLGNICRSPAAEAALRAQAPQLEIDSAGTSDWHIGDPPYGPMVAAGEARGYDLTPLRARQLTPADFDTFDLILCMDASNLERAEALRPKGGKAMLQLYLDYAPQTGLTDLPDPYYTRDFEQAFDLIEAATAGLLAQLAEQ